MYIYKKHGMGVLKRKEVDDEGGFLTAELSQILEAHSKSLNTHR